MSHDLAFLMPSGEEGKNKQNSLLKGLCWHLNAFPLSCFPSRPRDGAGKRCPNNSWAASHLSAAGMQKIPPMVLIYNGCIGCPLAH